MKKHNVKKQSMWLVFNIFLRNAWVRQAKPWYGIIDLQLTNTYDAFCLSKG